MEVDGGQFCGVLFAEVLAVHPALSDGATGSLSYYRKYFYINFLFGLTDIGVNISSLFF